MADNIQELLKLLRASPNQKHTRHRKNTREQFQQSSCTWKDSVDYTENEEDADDFMARFERYIEHHGWRRSSVSYYLVYAMSELIPGTRKNCLNNCQTIFGAKGRVYLQITTLL